MQSSAASLKAAMAGRQKAQGLSEGWGVGPSKLAQRCDASTAATREVILLYDVSSYTSYWPLEQVILRTVPYHVFFHSGAHTVHVLLASVCRAGPTCPGRWNCYVTQALG